MLADDVETVSGRAAGATATRVRPSTGSTWPAPLLSVSLRPVEVNGGLGAIIRDERQRLLGVWALEVTGGRITSINSIAKPYELAHLGPIGDVRSLPRTMR